MAVRILVVDDHADSTELLAILLRRRGYEVSMALTYEQAQYVAADRRPELIIADVGLPDGDGCELIKELRARYGIPGIAVSGYGMQSDIDRCMAAGILEFIQKPYRLEEIEASITRAIQQSPPPPIDGQKDASSGRWT